MAESEEPVLPGGPVRRLRFAWLWLVITSWFLLWALVKPPFQAPDEFAHLLKAQSVPNQPWFAERDVRVDSATLNPLLRFPKLYAIPFQSEVKITEADLEEMRAASWTLASGSEAYYSTSWSYPTLYYALAFAGGQAATRLLSLSPYQSVYAYRVVSCLLAGSLWVLVAWMLWQPLGMGVRSLELLAILVANPMLAFVSSSVSPDGVLYPLSALSMGALYLVLMRGSHGWFLFGSLLAGTLVKPSALVFVLAVACVAGLILLLRAAPLPFCLRALASSGASLALAFGVFYAWQAADPAGDPEPMSLGPYLLLVGDRLGKLFMDYWGTLGWLDYRIHVNYYIVLGGLFAANTAVVVNTWLRERKADFAFVALLVFLAHAVGVLALGFQLMDDVGWVMQGRYFLPAGLGVAAMALHDWRWLRVAWLLALGVVALRLLVESVDRYYRDGSLLWRAMPWFGS